MNRSKANKTFKQNEFTRAQKGKIAFECRQEGTDKVLGMGIGSIKKINSLRKMFEAQGKKVYFIGLRSIAKEENIVTCFRPW